MSFVPIICDFLVKDALGDPVIILRFDSIEALADPGEVDLTIDHMSVEPVTGSAAFTLTVAEFTANTTALRSFVARAFDEHESKWPHTVDEDLDITYSMDGTRVRVRALIGANAFDRTVDYSEPGGVPSLDFSLFMASDEMRIWSFMLALKAVETLVQKNTPGKPDPGGL